MAAPASQPRGPPREASEWARRSASIRIMLGGLSLLPDLERYYKSSIQIPSPRPSGSPTERLRVIGSSNPAAFMSR
ncbi:hypothetical protein RND71_035444 [Anisodus tanguticus]|uniref:Uncharacterized protein n=1 Tax=Anisodus tanguticus TaxID=243964 RepID=A0AAE1R587_9SOLA|nr:hypothetical protein RND71_035444 [Anisodus tanguticus]